MGPERCSVLALWNRSFNTAVIPQTLLQNDGRHFIKCLYPAVHVMLQPSSFSRQLVAGGPQHCWCPGMSASLFMLTNLLYQDVSGLLLSPFLQSSMSGFDTLDKGTSGAPKIHNLPCKLLSGARSPLVAVAADLTQQEAGKPDCKIVYLACMQPALGVSKKRSSSQRKGKVHLRKLVQPAQDAVFGLWILFALRSSCNGHNVVCWRSLHRDTVLSRC